MSSIKVYTSYSERNNRHYHTFAEIVSHIPEIGDDLSDDEIVTAVHPLRLDCEQPSDMVYNYDYFEIETVRYAGTPEEIRESRCFAVEC